MEIIVVSAWLYVTCRLLCYQRNGARFRRWVSVSAYALMVGAFARAVAIGIEHQPAHWSEAAVALALAALTWRARGNVACMLGRRP